MKKNITVLCVSHHMTRWRTCAKIFCDTVMTGIDFDYCEDFELQTHAPADLVVMDFGVGKRSAWEKVFELREHWPQTALLVCSEEKPPQALIHHFDLTGLGTVVMNSVSDEAVVQQIKTLLEQQKLYRKITNQAFYDALTGLPNGFLFRDRFDTAVHRVGRLGLGFGLAVFDIDQLQKVNQVYGFSCGDEVLVQVGRRFRERTRKSDTAARLGGDRFALIFENVIKEKTIVRLAEKLFEVMIQPFEIKPREGEGTIAIPVHFSMGICLFPQHLTEPCEVMAAAEVALKEAKKEEGPSLRLFKPPMGSGEVDLLLA